MATRFRGLGWHVLAVQDANDLAAIDKPIEASSSHKGSPTLIIVKSIIGYGAPTKAGTAKAHGEPLGDEEIAKTKAVYGWPTDAKFLVPPEVPKHFQDTLGKRGASCTRDVGEALRRLREEVSRAGRRTEDDPGARAAQGLGQATCRRSRPTPRAWPRASPAAKCSTPLAKKIPWLLGRLGRPRAVDQDAAHVRRSGRRFVGRQSRRPQPALRHPRARDGRRRQRHGPLRPAGVRRDVLRVHRLLPAVAAAGGDHEDPDDHRVHARFDRRRRRRADASADRATGRVPGDSASARAAARRRERNVRWPGKRRSSKQTRPVR